MQNILLTFIVVLGLNFQPKTYEPVVVLELFTSQGCSSCPAADHLLKGVKARYPANVIPLSYHVDYWNYIGWKDPFSKKSFTEKQRKYGSKFYSSSIYTPQVVVNGMEHFVGSKQRVLESKIQEYLKRSSSNNVTLSVSKKEPDNVAFNYKIDGHLKDKTLRIALVIEERITSVKRGENRNRVLKNANVVVAETYIKLKNASGNGAINIPDLVKPTDALRMVAIVENTALDITGAKQIKL